MNILVTNDDGIKAIGLKILVNKLLKYGNVYVISPDRCRSAASHSIIINGDLEFKLVDEIPGAICYQTDGLPTNCIGLIKALGVSIDIVFSGINDGLNLGTDIIYSGTVAAAREALIFGYPSVAISTDFKSFDIVNDELDDILDLVFNKKLYSNEYVLNINFPISKYKKSKGIKIGIQGKKIFDKELKKINDSKYGTLSEIEIHDARKNTDVYFADNGYITFVPLKIDQTDHLNVESLKQLINEGE